MPHTALPPQPQATPLPTRAVHAIALTIAGHDPSGGAGITADLQTFAAHGLFGTSAITALTVQSTLGVVAVEPVRPELLRQTLGRLCADLPPAGIKIGMLGSAGIAAIVADFLATLRASARPPIPVVLDPVLRASSGTALLPPEDLAVITTRLLPVVDWITPNWAELNALSGQPDGNLGQLEQNAGPEQKGSRASVPSSEADAAAAMHRLGQRYPHLHIVATGGDQTVPTDLLRLPSGELYRFPGEHIPTASTHGTGCAFSSALLSRLVLADSPADAVAAAKYFVTGALRHAPGLGHGRGPLDLLWRLRR